MVFRVRGGDQELVLAIERIPVVERDEEGIRLVRCVDRMRGHLQARATLDGHFCGLEPAPAVFLHGYGAVEIVEIGVVCTLALFDHRQLTDVDVYDPVLVGRVLAGNRFPVEARRHRHLCAFNRRVAHHAGIVHRAFGDIDHHEAHFVGIDHVDDDVLRPLNDRLLAVGFICVCGPRSQHQPACQRRQRDKGAARSLDESPARNAV